MGVVLRRVGILTVGLLLIAPAGGGQALARPKPAAAAGTVGGFSFGQLQDQKVGASGCGTNVDGEPSAHVSKANLVEVGSEEGIGGGSELWRATQLGGSTSADACQPAYSGQPNAVTKGVGAAGGDIDTAFGPVRSSAGTYRLYVASLNLGSINVAVSNDDGKTFSQTPVQGGLPLDDREWIAAYGADTSLLTYHDIASNNIDVLRSDNGGGLYTQIATAIPATDYRANNNELGNIVIDHVNAAPGGFWAYQSFVAPSTSSGSTYDEAFLAVSSDGGHTWTDKPIPCTTAFGGNGLGHNFPNVSVAPNGTLFYAMSNDTSVYVASSADHGNTWTCSAPVSTTAHAIFPWIVATSAGEDLVYYGTPTADSGQTWSVYFAQNPAQSVSGWTTTQLMPVHTGAVCEGGISCTGGRQLLDDFAVDTDQSGWAHIAYSHDSPDLGGSSTYTGYAVQQSGTPAGAPN